MGLNITIAPTDDRDIEGEIRTVLQQYKGKAINDNNIKCLRESIEAIVDDTSETFSIDDIYLTITDNTGVTHDIIPYKERNNDEHNVRFVQKETEANSES